MDRRAGQQLVKVSRAGTVAAQQAVIPQDPEIAALRDRLLRRFRYRIRVRESLVGERCEQLRQLLLGKSEEIEVNAV